MGRFINADALVSTGQGLLGNNMLSYCQNNPVTCYDPSGQAAIWRATVSSHMNIDLFLGDGGGYAYASSSAQAGSSILAKLKNMVNNPSPTTAQQNLKTNGATFYKGTLVISTALPVDRTALSYGVIVMDDYYQDAPFDTFSKTINHEYGHAQHLATVGIVSYTLTTAIPSLIGAGITDSNIPVLSSWISSNYYNLPWERIADYYGGVVRNHAPIANTIGAIYWVYTFAHGS